MHEASQALWLSVGLRISKGPYELCPEYPGSSPIVHHHLQPAMNSPNWSWSVLVVAHNAKLPSLASQWPQLVEFQGLESQLFDVLVNISYIPPLRSHEPRSRCVCVCQYTSRIIATRALGLPNKLRFLRIQSLWDLQTSLSLKSAQDPDPKPGQGSPKALQAHPALRPYILKPPTTAALACKNALRL